MGMVLRLQTVMVSANIRPRRSVDWKLMIDQTYATRATHPMNDGMVLVIRTKKCR